MRFIPHFFNLSGMDPSRAAVCWLTPAGERGTAHDAPITITDGALWPRLAGEYTPAARPEQGNDICFFIVDHGNPDCDQLVFDKGDRRA